jgi:ribulose-5-phosphate 4-epimerase/fuculose-1-phosphate aldolase
MVQQTSKIPLICRRAFYADLATAGAAVGMGSAADATSLAALQAAVEAPQLDPDYADLDPELVVDLVAANHILAHNGILDSFGHVSVRDPRNAHRYLQMQAIAPRDVTVNDLITFDLDSNAINARGRPVYRERFIHGEIYKVRPDVNAIVHSHSPGVIPFGVTEKPLRAIFHNGHFLGHGVPVWEIRKTAGEKNGMLVNTSELGKSLAQTLGDGSVVLMRGHGDAVAGPDLKTTVFRAIYTEVNARLQMQAVALGGPINFLNQYEQAKSQNVDRPWDTWRKQVGAG